MTGDCGAVQGGRGVSRESKSHKPEAQRFSCPRASGPSKPRSYTINDIKARLTPAHIEGLCRAWMPNGKRQGKWWLACSPWRDDTNPSLGVSLSSGRWKDFATGEGGDLFDLSMRLFNDSLADTIRGFAEMLGMADA